LETADSLVKAIATIFRFLQLPSKSENLSFRLFPLPEETVTLS
jgi:hypothetical protein